MPLVGNFLLLFCIFFYNWLIVSFLFTITVISNPYPCSVTFFFLITLFIYFYNFFNYHCYILPFIVFFIIIFYSNFFSSKNIPQNFEQVKNRTPENIGSSKKKWPRDHFFLFDPECLVWCLDSLNDKKCFKISQLKLNN